MTEFDKVTTRTGDKGESSLYDGTRLRKDDLIFDALGDSDELTSYIGLLKHMMSSKKSILEQIQRDLMNMGSMIATPEGSELYETIPKIDQDSLTYIEKEESKLLKSVEIKREFVLPGSTVASAHADIARTICRRLERKLVALIRNSAEMQHLIICQQYSNRLSDLLFIVARYAEKKL